MAGAGAWRRKAVSADAAAFPARKRTRGAEIATTRHLVLVLAHRADWDSLVTRPFRLRPLVVTGARAHEPLARRAVRRPFPCVLCNGVADVVFFHAGTISSQ